MAARSWFAGVASLFALVLACAPLLPSAAAPASKERRVTLALPRAPAADEAVWVRVTAGVLPRGTRIVVRLSNGEIAGTVSPFGVRPGRKAGAYTIPLPQEAIAKGEVELHLQLVGKDAAAGRAPSADEVEAVELIYVPVTRSKKSSPAI